MTLNRRRFLQTFGAAAAVSLTPTLVRANSAPKVIVVGGGFAGATAAKYLRMWSGGTIDVSLIDPNAAHTSCVLSNLVLNRRLSLSKLQISYDNLAANYGVNIVRDRVVAIEDRGRRVALEQGGDMACDRLIVAGGIDFKRFPDLDFQLTPHAWIAGPQTTLLMGQLGSLGPDSTFVMTVPKSPYRCPPGPYERACLVADILKRKGYDNGDAKVVVLDENPSIQAERHTFERAFYGIYGNIVDYIPNAIINNVVSRERLVQTTRGDFRGDVVNVIAPQQAPKFVRDSGLTGHADWAAVDPLTYESRDPLFSGVHIIGDSQASSQPKSAHMANAQAKICADAIIRDYAGLSNSDPERIANITTNSACYSPITYDEASWLTANFAYNATSGRMDLTHIGEADRWDQENYEDMFDWASNLFNDTFG